MKRALPALRPATLSDAASMARIVAAWVAETDWAEKLYTLEDLEARFIEALPSREAWVADDPVQAYLSLNPQTGQIGGLYCQNRGQGLGHALMQRAKAGRDRLWLHVYEKNLRARQFYAREGFVEVSRHLPQAPSQLAEVRMEWGRHA